MNDIIIIILGYSMQCCSLWNMKSVTIEAMEAMEAMKPCMHQRPIALSFFMREGPMTDSSVGYELLIAFANYRNS